jgi:hypothetical protein
MMHASQMLFLERGLSPAKTPFVGVLVEVPNFSYENCMLSLPVSMRGDLCVFAFLGQPIWVAY